MVVIKPVNFSPPQKIYLPPAADTSATRQGIPLQLNWPSNSNWSSSSSSASLTHFRIVTRPIHVPLSLLRFRPNCPNLSIFWQSQYCAVLDGIWCCILKGLEGKGPLWYGMIVHPNSWSSLDYHLLQCNHCSEIVPVQSLQWNCGPIVAQYGYKGLFNNIKSCLQKYHQKKDILESQFIDIYSIYWKCCLIHCVPYWHSHL